MIVLEVGLAGWDAERFGRTDVKRDGLEEAGGNIYSLKCGKVYMNPMVGSI